LKHLQTDLGQFELAQLAMHHSLETAAMMLTQFFPAEIRLPESKAAWPIRLWGGGCGWNCVCDCD
jgi:hypothetical protein